MSQLDKIRFKNEVIEIVGQIPKGKVMTYGQIAVFCGHPRAARIVGGIAHFGPEDLPWQRVVNKNGGLAKGYPGGIERHAALLENEGLKVVDNKVDVKKLIWQPN